MTVIRCGSLRFLVREEGLIGCIEDDFEIISAKAIDE